MKVKPEYMTEFGENLDCCIIGGYYGSGKRGGGLSSFMCGLRVNENHVSQGANPQKFYSFFKVGGGFRAEDYAAIRHATDGKWKKWDPKRPPTEYIELAGGQLQYERPDEWILPSDSVVVEVKAASVSATDQFRMGFTLRFPRFKKLRNDRDWESALSISGFTALKANVEKEGKEKQFKIDDGRRKRQRIQRKKPLTIAGSEVALDASFAGKATKVFEGLQFYIMTPSQKPQKKSKPELEQMVKSHGGKIVQKDAGSGTICIGDQRTIPVAAACKRGNVNIVRPSWLFDNNKQSEADGARPTLILPLEPRHMFFTTPESAAPIEGAVDEFGDSFARDITVDELKDIFDSMPTKYEHSFTASQFRSELENHDHDLGTLPAWTFEGLLIYADSQDAPDSTPAIQKYPEIKMKQACNTARFAGARVTNNLKEGVTHVLVGDDASRIQDLRQRTSVFKRLPRLVTVDWIEQSWQEKTLLDEERFAPH